ncbi:MAG: hypothetical protein RBU21_20690 [FCB group bacterium]|jgi:hypothetical protein|nr:hypothetical protein [FCB group bacterium]
MRYAVLAALVCGAAWGQEFGVSFDADLKSTQGDAPVLAEKVLRVEGREGGAGLFLEGAVLTYPVAGRYSPRLGTLDVWVCPNWDSDAPSDDKFFWGVAGGPKKDARTVLGFLSRNNQGIVYFGGDGALGGLTAEVDWRPREWHRITVCWDQANRCRALYIDGALRHHIRTGAAMPADVEVFYVGSLPCVTRWLGVMDGHEADAAIDGLTLSSTIDMPDFELVRQAAREDEKAIARTNQSREKAKPAYEAAWERLLRDGPTLDAVAANRHEAAWDELTGMAAPMTQRVPIEPRYYSDVVYVHPDLSIALGRAADALGLGFASGPTFELPDPYAVTRTLNNGYRPIVESRWQTNGCEIEQTAFTILPRDVEVSSGTEAQYTVVRMKVRNASAETRTVPLYVMVGRMQDTQNTNYQPFAAAASRWLEPVMPLTLDGDAVLLDGKPFLVFRGDAASTHVPEFATGTADPLMPETLRNVLKFEFELGANAEKTLDLVTVASPEVYAAEEIAAMRQTTFDAALARAAAYWDRALEPGMKWTTPEPRLNDVYKHLILSCLGNLRKNPERPWHEPYQSPAWTGVWPWECAHMLVPMAAIGYHRELEPTYRFFTERQSGIGQYGEPGRKPEGETVSAHGCYTGNFLLRWTCETGSVLWAMAAKYQYSQDVDWLKANRETVLAAWDWIQGERARTRRFDDSGEKAAYYGLLPKGRVHDWEGWHYHFFSDVFTWKGMDEMANAFATAGLPDAERLREEADEYRACILEAIHKSEYIDPATGLPFVPNMVATQEGEKGGLWWADGPACMFATGLLDARTDERFNHMFAYLEKTWGTLIGLTNRMDEPAELGRRNPFWYVNCSERGYFQNLLARDETEKALLILYSNLAYGLSQDCYQTVERIHVGDANYSPFQPNASGNGRLLDMFKRMVIDDQDEGTLWLLRGCPRRWFAEGQSVVVEDAPTRYGKMALRTSATANAITVDVTAPEKPVELRVVFRDAAERVPVKATVNGADAAVENGVVKIAGASGTLKVVCEY